VFVVVAGLASATPARAVTPDEATALGREAYTYGFPLLEFLRVRQTGTSVPCPSPLGAAPVNAFASSPSLATPLSRTVVAPNVDTLYSIAQLDLGQGPVVLSHPTLHRYFVFQLLDPYTNTIGYIGSRTTGRRKGRFAITWTGHRGKRVKRAKVVKSRYRRLWVIGRTLVKGAEDRANAVEKIRRFTLTPPGGARTFPADCRPGLPKQAPRLGGAAFLDALGPALAENPPPKRDAPALARLATVGIGPGTKPDPAVLGQDVYAALVAGATQAAQMLPGLVTTSLAAQAARNHGWTTPGASIGSYGTDYTTRAAVAQVGLGANTREEAVYPTALTDSLGRPFDSSGSYRIVFPAGQLPPVRAFWSLTLYNGAGYLVPNRERRYATGPTHDGFARKPDGSVVVVVQRARPTEPDVNWLPTPRRGAFRLTLRLYVPRKGVLSGAWTPPPVDRVG
jgi:hypothetical protein